MTSFKEKPSVVFIGLGALGILYAKTIEEALGPYSVSFAADAERVKRYSNETITLNGKPCFFNFFVPAAESKKADFLFFSVKGTALKAAIKTVSPLVGQDTVIISLLNGISSEEVLKESFPDASVLYCIGQKMDARKSGHEVIFRDLGELCIGIPKVEETPKLLSVLEKTRKFFRKCGVPFVAEEDIIHRLWCKWMLNVGVNQAVMVHEGIFRTVHEEGAPRELMIEAMKEVQTLSHKNGINISDEEFKQYLSIIDHLNPDGMPSMRQDGFARKPSEVDLFAGTVVALGKKLGVPTPINKKILSRVREIEAGY